MALGEESLGLGADDADLEVFNVVDQTAEFGRGVAHGGGAEVTLHAPAEVDGLADVDNGTGTVAIEIATGLFWQVFEFLAQDVVHAAIVAKGGGRWPPPENGERKTERAGAKRQTFHGHGARGKRATGRALGVCGRFALRG